MKLIIEKNKIKNEVDTKATTLPPMPKLRPPKDTTDFEISSNAGRVRLLTMLQSLLDIRKRQIEKTSDIVMFDDVLDDDGMEIPTAKKLFPDDESLKAAIKKVNPGLYQKKMEEDNLEEKRKKKKKKKDACYHKVKRRYKVWPSAYASGALVKCRKVGAKNWGNKSKKKK